MFYDIIFEINDSHCIKKTFCNDKYLIWFSLMLKDLICMKKVAHILYKQITSHINYNGFSKLRAKSKSQSKLDYNNYISYNLITKTVLNEILNYLKIL